MPRTVLITGCGPSGIGTTLRTELAPLRVHVATLKTGSVRTPLFDNAPPTKLPADSLYQPVRSYVEGRHMLDGAQFMSPQQYANKVVGELLRPSVKHVIWAGGLATLAWFLSWFGWEGMLDKMQIKRNQLDKIRK